MQVSEHGRVVWSLAGAYEELERAMLARKPKNHAELLRAMMKVLRQSDEGMAELMRIPVGTIRGWKQQRRNPPPVAKRFIELAARAPMVAFQTDHHVLVGE